VSACPEIARLRLLSKGGEVDRRALCIGIDSFGDFESQFEPLPFAAKRVEAVEAALTRLTYACSVADAMDLPTAEALGERVQRLIQAGSKSDVHVVHVVSHGVLRQSGVYVVGADARYAESSSVADWIRRFADFPDRATTLFLVDTCHSGEAARIGWLPAAADGDRAWVIAAAARRSEEASGTAYDGVFSRAAAEILTEISDGRIDLYPSEYVKFGELVELIRQRVTSLSDHLQRVTSTPVDGAPAPPFVPNPRRPTDVELSWARQNADVVARPFLNLDTTLDPAHFLERASGGPGRFIGRADILRRLSERLDEPLQLVTGGAGSGKSAVLGILVCAAHPQLRESTARLWATVPEDALPSPDQGMAAIHLRERDLAEAVAGLARQLGLPQTEEPEAMIAAMGTLARRPLIVMDALDEAVDQQALVSRLLLPLVQADVCRLVVGTRPWPEFDRLISRAKDRDGLLDLDLVPLAQLRSELTEYVTDALGRAWGRIPQTLVSAVTSTLLTPGRGRGGEFLFTRTYLNWLLADHPSGISDPQAAELADRIPSTLPELLDLDLLGRDSDVWALPVLQVLATARGSGMPITIVRRLAPALLDRSSSSISDERLWRAMKRIRFYLRSQADVDGVSLYRLMHQSLVDHLCPPDEKLSALYDRLVESAPPGTDGVRLTDGAEPYVARHRVRHAVDAGRLDELLHEPAELLTGLFDSTSTGPGVAAAAIWHESAHRRPELSPIERRRLLAVDAARRGEQVQLNALAGSAGMPEPTLWPRWATGTGTASLFLAAFRASAGKPTTIAYTVLDKRPVVVTGDEAGRLQVTDLQSGAELLHCDVHTSPVVALTCFDLDGTPAVASVAVGGELTVWEAATGRIRHRLGGPAGWKAMTCGIFGDGPVVAAGDSNRLVTVWDARTGAVLNRIPGAMGDIQAIACTGADSRPAVAISDSSQAVRLYDPQNGEELARWQGSELRPGLAFMRRDGHDTLVGGDLRGLHFWGQDQEPEFIENDEGGCYETVFTEVGGRPIAAQRKYEQLDVWDLGERRKIARLFSRYGWVESIACGTRNARPVVVAVGSSGTARVWPLFSSEREGILQGHTERVRTVACATVRGRLTAVTCSEDSLRMWDVAEGREKALLAADPGLVLHVACADLPEGPVAVTSTPVTAMGRGYEWYTPGPTREESARVWDLTTERETDPLGAERILRVRHVACAVVQGRPVAVTADEEGTVEIWDLETRRRSATLAKKLGDFWKFDHSRFDRFPTGLICTVIGGRSVAIVLGFNRKLWECDLANLRRRWRGVSSAPATVTDLAAATAKGHPAVVAVTDAQFGKPATVDVVDLTTGRLAACLLSIHATVTGLGCAGSLAVVGDAKGVRLWDLDDFHEIDRFELPHGGHALAISPTGELLVATDSDLVCLATYRN
jgi:WD40 repeat protein